MRLCERVGGEGPADGFLDVPWRVHRHDPYWVPEDRTAVEACLGPDSLWFGPGASGRTFCVPGQVRTSVFRTAGLVVDGVPAAFFGHWASTGDAGADALVLAAAQAWARDAGAARLYGPVDLTPAIGHLVRVSGGEGRPPYTGEPHNPPRYAPDLEALGLTIDRRYVSVELGGGEMRALAEAAAGTHRDLTARGYRFEPLTPELWDEHHAEVHALGIFAGNFGAASVTPDQIQALYGPSWAARLDPEISVLLFAPEGDIAGYVFCYPDYGPLVIQAAGADRRSPRALSYAEHAPLLRAAGHNAFVLKMGGAAPRHRRRGLAHAATLVSLTRAARKGMTRCITGPMYSENPIRRVFRGGHRDERWYAIHATDLPGR
jgi:hypothetical protein